MAGLGLEDFLSHNKQAAKRKFLKNWQKDGKIAVWLSTRAAIAYPTWTHGFQYHATYEDKDGNTRDALRFTRFVSPDPEIVHANQYFRDEGSDRLRVPPAADPFLLLREWLRHDCDQPLDAVVFEWTDPQSRETIQWKRGHLARLEERGQRNWNHSLDTKLEYMFVVVDDETPGEGPQIVRVSKLLGDCVREVIENERESNGADEGNPLINPYAFLWKYDKGASSPMKSYTATRYNKAKLTAAVREAITSTEFPDPTQDTRPRAGDKARLRAAMEDAARIDLPWDSIFTDAWKDDDPTEFDTKKMSSSNGKPTSKRSPEVDTKSDTKSDTKPEKKKRTKKKSETRRKKKVETVPCDECKEDMEVTATRCTNCGAEYEVDGAGDESGEESGSSATCWSCNGPVKNDTCEDCGLDVGDDFPF